MMKNKPPLMPGLAFFVIAALIVIAAVVSAQPIGDVGARKLDFQVDARTIADNGGGGAATLTLTPVGSFVELTCNDTQGCTITMGETGIPDGMILHIVGLTTLTPTFADTAGVTELSAALTMGQYDTLTLVYASDRWVELMRSNN